MVESFGILGGGFGLYGYLVALSKLDKAICLPDKYIETIQKRPELIKYMDNLIFLRDEDDVANSVDALVIAKHTDFQFDFMINGKTRPIKYFLEKPLASSFEKNLQFIKFLYKNQPNFSLGYIFEYLPWYRHVVNRESSFQIYWRIPMASAKWKTQIISQFGLMHYYGLHFVPLFLELGVEPEEILIENCDQSLFIKCGRLNFEILLSKSTEALFCVSEGFADKSHPKFCQSSPFGPLPKNGETDPRVESLELYLKNNLAVNNSNKYLKIEEYYLRIRELNSF